MKIKKPFEEIYDGMIIEEYAVKTGQNREDN